MTTSVIETVSYPTKIEVTHYHNGADILMSNEYGGSKQYLDHWQIADLIEKLKRPDGTMGASLEDFHEDHPDYS